VNFKHHVRNVFQRCACIWRSDCKFRCVHIFEKRF